jgi:thioredoxin reductase/NAD-dependent dihydropyrimidine dehydrogenase PreA subunit
MTGPTASLLARYARWLHLRWPAGRVEPLPEIGADGGTGMPGVYVAGDLTGIPLLKFALDGGARLARAIAADPRLATERAAGRAPAGAAAPHDLVVVGAGVAGMAAAVEARRLGLDVEVIEAGEPFSTLVNFPRAKPIYTYPTTMTPAGTLQVTATVREALIDELRDQVERAGIRPRAGRAERVARERDGLVVHLAGGGTLAARRVLIAIGRSGEFRRLGVPGESLPKVANRLHDPRDFAGREVLVAGGGDAALETAIALAGAGASVTLVCRGSGFPRARPALREMLERLRRDPAGDIAIEHPSAERETSATGPFPGAGRAAGRITVRTSTRVASIGEDTVVLTPEHGGSETLPNDAVFTMLGRAAPLGFFRRSGLAIAGEMTPARRAAMALFLVACAWLYDWKSGGVMAALWQQHHWFPTNLPALLESAGGTLATAARDPRSLVGTLAISAAGPSFWYTLAYSIVVVVFGLRRIRRRRTPYVNVQTLTLMAVQVLPLFLVPEILLPQLHAHGLLPPGLADALFPAVDYGHGREFWRAYGLILAWPLNVYNLFTQEPLWAWIAIGFVQTCVLIPLGIRTFGKGVYCGWICSCGALAETLGDTHRHRMPHGPRWNRLNLAGQAVLAIAVVLLGVRIAGWMLPAGNWVDVHFDGLLKERYKWTVDVFLAGVIGYGLYFWYSGRVWCRFFCPLAALMHVYTRFSRFAIVADKRKCISCNVCTSVCHQGIDVMNFANKGLPMQDPQCVRCSACVQSCPTGVLRFGQVRRDGSLISVDSLMASPVLMREGR